MSRLVCDAVNCGNNHDRLCALEGIEVSGCSACACEGTCCKSFVDEKNAYISSFADVSASEDTHIDCEAGTCAYNVDGICEADRVKIEGQYAHRMDATCCASFRKKA